MTPFALILSIIQKSFRFTWAPFLLTPEEYWKYLSGEQSDHNLVATIFLSILFVLLLGYALLVWVFGMVWWTILLFVLLVGLVLFGTLYAFGTRSPRTWWKTACIFSILSVLISLLLAPLFGIGLFGLYLSVSHLVSLIRTRSIAFK